RNSTANRDGQRGARARLFRLLELRGAPENDYQLHSSAPTPLSKEQKDALVAEGWRLAVGDMGAPYAFGLETRIPSAERAVAGYRALVRDGGPAQQRIDLALALQSLAWAHQSVARHAKSPTDLARLLEGARLSAQESLDILEALRGQGKLPE